MKLRHEIFNGYLPHKIYCSSSPPLPLSLCSFPPSLCTEPKIHSGALEPRNFSLPLPNQSRHKAQRVDVYWPNQDTKQSGLIHAVEFGHWIIDIEFRHAVLYTKKNKICGTARPQKMNCNMARDNCLWIFPVASTRFAKLGSLCQNSPHKQIRANTRKSAILICVRLKLRPKLNNPSSKCHGWQNNSHWHHLNTLSDQQQHTASKKSFLFTVFSVPRKENFQN